MTLPLHFPTKKSGGKFLPFQLLIFLIKIIMLHTLKKGSFDESNKESLVALLREISKN